MSNELQKVQQEQNSVFANSPGYQQALEIAKTLASSELVPDTYRNKPANCIIALDVARQVRNSPLVVMQNLNIIKGKPSWSSTYIAASIRSRYRNIKVETTGEGMNRGCRVIAYDDYGAVIAEGARVTMQMAKDEGWIDKAGSKWKTMPELMLQYRANAFFGRVYCPDMLIGLQSEYEIQDAQRTPERTEIPDPFAVTPDTTSQVQPVEEPVIQTEPEYEPVDVVPQSEFACSKCCAVITEKVFNYSKNKFGKVLCFTCQREVK